MRGSCLAIAAAFLSLTFLAVDSTRGGESGKSRPNFVIILVDDMGYSDPGCFGGEIATPNLDQLASEGVRFTQFYNCSRCCPTRASLLTGAYPQRIGMGEFGRTMDLDVPTLGEHLRAAGYQTAMTGKWHLSQLPGEPAGAKRILWMNHELDLDLPFGDPASYPINRGFDRFYGMIWGVFDHFDPFSLMEDHEPVREVPDDYYVTDSITEYTMKYIRDFSAAEQPFFLYVAYSAPHWPVQAPKADIEKYRGRYEAGWDALRKERFQRQVGMGLVDPDTPLGEVVGPAWDELTPERQFYEAAKMEVHAAMVDRVDQGIGRIIEQLKESGEYDNTVMFFMSDNGASPEIPGGPGYDRNGGTRDGREALREDRLRQPENRDKLGSDESYTGIGAPWASAVNAPLRLWKMESYEGGCRTPLIVHWPAGLQLQKGSFTDAVGHVIDVTPTCLELAGADQVRAFEMDGKSFAPLLTGQPLPANRTLFFSHGEGRGIRQGDWKASKRGGSDNRWQLFDLSKDPGETHDLAEEQPALLRKLTDEWQQWNSSVNGEGGGFHREPVSTH